MSECRIFLIRHGQQSSRLCNVNVGLSPQGISQAELVAKRLTTYGIEELYCSELIRAIETAEIIGKEIGLTPVVKPDLQEIDFGGFEGLSDKQIVEQYGDLRYRIEYGMQEDLHYPDGENGREAGERIRKALTALTKEGHGRIAVVTHGCAMRCFLAGLFGESYAQKYQFSRIMENCSITELVYDPKHDRFNLERLNDFAHLEGHPELMRSLWLKKE
ncbi:MAG: histidine phosphatase family protein [Lachnospiraceae bacterium]|nr:histidine phosphatase family protein [Lachnospiraceae bacterium]